MSDIPPLATLSSSAPRRIVALGILLVLGGMLLMIAFGPQPFSVLWRLGLGAFGLAVLYLSGMMLRATRGQLILTADALVDADGTVLAKTDDIQSVNRGAFAIKPSNGFMLILSQPAPRAWRPGLWWRLGRRVAVGGITPGQQTRIMAEQIEQILMTR